MLTLLAFLFGLLIGSFLNVCVYRLPRDLSVIRPARSFCPQCEKQIAWYDNIPLLSFLILGGRCRNCRGRIPWRYPIVELATAIAFAVSFSTFDTNWLPAFKYAVFSAIIIALVASDLEERILPDEFTLGGALLGLVFAALVPAGMGLMYLFLPTRMNPRLVSVIEAMFSAAISGGAIWLVGELYYRVRRREGLGLGDVKMVAMVATFLGLQGALLTLIVGSLLGGIVGLIYILLTGKNASTYELPFGSFLGLAALIVAVAGGPVITWYARMG